jgi:hypothetical protein
LKLLEKEERENEFMAKQLKKKAARIKAQKKVHGTDVLP